MNTAEVIRETRARLFEDGWSSGSRGRHGEGCVLTTAARVLGMETAGVGMWLQVCSDRPDVVRALAAAVDQLSPAIFVGDNMFRVYAYNDTFGRTFDEIVELTEIAEKIAEINDYKESK